MTTAINSTPVHSSLEEEEIETDEKINRNHVTDDSILPSNLPSPTKIAQIKRKMGMKKVVANGVVLTLALWMNTMWLYGGFYNSNSRVYQLEVLVADFDGGAVGSALLSAVSTINGSPSVPTFTTLPANSTSPDDLLKRLYDGKCWGIIYASANSTSSFSNALISSSYAAAYVPQNAIIYSGLEVRYSTTFSGFVLPSILQVAGITSGIFAKITVAPLLLKASTPAQLPILLNPIGSTFINLAPFNFGSRVMLNTVGTVLPILLQFFFLLGMNGIMTMSGIYTNTTFKKLLKDRLPIQLIWTLITSLSFSGWTLVFQETYSIGSFSNFLALWAAAFFFAFITFDFLDALTTFLPLPVAPPVVVTFILISVASTSVPIELQVSFFKIHYAFFPHAVWSTMIVIFGKGATGESVLKWSLPVIAIWLVGAKVFALLALRKRARPQVVGVN